MHEAQSGQYRVSRLGCYKIKEVVRNLSLLLSLRCNNFSKLSLSFKYLYFDVANSSSAQKHPNVN